jgi:hypothetical protein
MLAVTAKDIRTSVAWIMQDLNRAAVRQWTPEQLPLSRAAARAAWEEQLLVAKRLDGGARRSCAAKGSEKVAYAVLCLLVWVEYNAVG